MHISRLEVSHLRNLTSVSLFPGQRLNLLYGRNASGKTSLLEAIHLLFLARSFRSQRTSHIVQHGEQSLLLFAEFFDTADIPHRLGLQRFIDNKTLIRLDGRHLRSRAELVSLLPLQLLTPESTQLLSGGPRLRRQYLDWIMFHVEPHFHANWLNYQRLLKQRNTLLRLREVDTLKYWDTQLIHHGETIDRLRKALVDGLQAAVAHYVSILLPQQTVRFLYRQGWRQETNFANALSENLVADLKRTVTGVGPHRCDLFITTADNRPVVEVFSRGQLKLLVVALMLAQIDYLATHTTKRSLVLIDDLPAELDAEHRRLMLSLLHDHGHQVFLTTTDRTLLDCSPWPDTKVFHVEHGQVKEVV